VLRKIFKRTVLLFLIGLAINWFDHAIGGDVLCFGHLRIWAVLQRIALCYLAASLFAIYANHKYTIPTIVGLLVIYILIITLGNGYAFDAEANILAQVDLHLFGYDHLYHKSPVDPEGLVSTIPAIAHTLIGFLCGKLVCSKVSPKEKVRNIFIFGLLLTIAGFALSLWLPLNKRIWSPSFVLATCGLAMLLLALIMKIEQWAPSSMNKGGWVVLLVFGMNPLFLYVLSEFMAIIFGHFGISTIIFDSIHSVISAPKWASLCYALTFVLLNWLVGYVLYRKKIFIKI
jgi:predicted acyltransferase